MIIFLILRKYIETESITTFCFNLMIKISSVFVSSHDLAKTKLLGFFKVQQFVIPIAIQIYCRVNPIITFVTVKINYAF